MRPIIAAGLMLAALQLPIADPFRGARSRFLDASGKLHGAEPYEEAVVARADMEKNSRHPLFLTKRAIHGHDVAFLRAWTGSGTGYGQVTYYVYRLDGPEPRLAWNAVAEESWTPARSGRGLPKRYHVRSCLYLAGDTLLYVASEDRAEQRPDNISPLRQSGAYTLTDSGSSRTGPVDRRAIERCHNEPSLLDTR